MHKQLGINTITARKSPRKRAEAVSAISVSLINVPPNGCDDLSMSTLSMPEDTEVTEVSTLSGPYPWTLPGTCTSSYLYRF